MAEPRGREGIAAAYQAARSRGDTRAMWRSQNEEACLVLLTILERLAGDASSFVHEVALKGGILMAGELRSPRASADIDATAGHQRRLDPDRVVADLRRAGREFGLRLDGEPDRTAGGMIVRLRFDSLTDGGAAKLEISVREDPVFAVRDALFDVSDLGLASFTLPAVAEAELVAEKIRALVQRAQPRDLFDLHLYLVESGWHFDPAALRQAVDAKLSMTRHRRWRSELWRTNLDEIEAIWDTTMPAWVEPARLPSFTIAVDGVARRMRALRLD
ncbi:MAG: nucleotidyl transferase AbiEii/AbiGii toxin family protein [Candidatus Limnocylindrales bacterium]